MSDIDTIRFNQIGSFQLACANLFAALEISKHGLLIGALVRVGIRILDESRLNKNLLDLHIINNARVTPRSLAEAAILCPYARHAHTTGELARAVWNELDFGETVRANRLIFFEAVDTHGYGR